jgi:anti-sigma-K factor RskA
MTPDEIKDLGALYALGALDPATASEIEVYLRTAPPEERREIEELAEVAALLPFALPQPRVPAHLKDQLLARLNQAPAATPAEAVPSSNVIPFTPPTRAQSQPAWRMLIAASVTLAALSALLLWHTSRLNRQITELTQQVNDQAQQLAAKQQEQDQLLSPLTRVISLTGEAAPQASAKLAWDTARQEWVIYIYNLPRAPADKDYQLWYITSDQSKISAQVFHPDAQDRIELRLSLPSTLSTRLAATAITLEPKGGSVQPTGQIFLKGAI